MPALRKAQARDRKREKAQRPKLHGGSIRRVYPDAIKKALRPRRNRHRGFDPTVRGGP